MRKQVVMTANHLIGWTEQHRYLWTGRHGGEPVGTIERGARYNSIDVQGAEHHGFSTLHAAQSAAEASLSTTASQPRI